MEKAKYTELLADYLNTGGELPSVFSEIEGFSDLFVAYYCDKEIGFETEDLFEIKLEAYANIYVPVYKQRINELAVAWLNASNPVKVHYETGSTTVNVGEQKTSTTELPFNATTATPNGIVVSDPSENTDERETTREESGTTVDEAYRVIDKLNEAIHPIILKLLDEFKPCFMEIY